MCLLILQRAGAKALPKAHIRNAWESNHDGSGYAFVADGKIVVRKPLMKLKQLEKQYYADHAQYGATSPFLVHFRFSTHGAVNGANCHPFPVANGQVVMGHNGMLPFDSPLKEESDTAWFARSVVGNRNKAHVMSAGFNVFLEDLIGTGNKLVFLSEDGTFSIVNEAKGHWCMDNETWYSNYNYVNYKELYGGYGTCRGTKVYNWDKYKADKAKSKSLSYTPVNSGFSDADLYDLALMHSRGEMGGIAPDDLTEDEWHVYKDYLADMEWKAEYINAENEANGDAIDVTRDPDSECGVSIWDNDDPTDGLTEWEKDALGFNRDSD